MRREHACYHSKIFLIFIFLSRWLKFQAFRGQPVCNSLFQRKSLNIWPWKKSTVSICQKSSWNLPRPMLIPCPDEIPLFRRFVYIPFIDKCNHYSQTCLTYIFKIYPEPNLTASYLLDHDYSKFKLLPSAAWIPTIISNCSGFFSFGPPTSTPQLAWFCRNSGQIMSLLSSNPFTYPSKSPKSSQGPTGPVPPGPQLLLLLPSLSARVPWTHQSCPCCSPATEVNMPCSLAFSKTLLKHHLIE